MPFLQFQLRKFQKGRSEDRQLRMSALQRAEMFQRAVASPKSKVEPRQIPLGKGAAWLGRIPRPAIKFSARRFSFASIKLVQFRENARQISIRGPMFDKIFQCIVAGFRRFQLKMGIGEREKRSGGCSRERCESFGGVTDCLYVFDSLGIKH